MSLPTLCGQSYIVTGCASGIGRATALYLGRSGCNLALTDIDGETAQSLLEELASMSDQASDPAFRFNFVFSAFDATDLEKVRRFVYSTRKTFQDKLCGLVHCAGVNPECPPAHQMEYEQFQDIIDINLKSTFLFDQAALQVLRAQGPDNAPQGGYAIVNMGSVSGSLGQANFSAYCASKFAVHGLTRAIARENGDVPIRCNAIAPGPVATPLLGRLGLNETPSFLPIQRVAQPEEIASVVAFLLSPAASYINGHIQAVDAGWLA